MLRALDIRDILIIDHLELDFRPGLNVPTGRFSNLISSAKGVPEAFASMSINSGSQ